MTVACADDAKSDSDAGKLPDRVDASLSCNDGYSVVAERIRTGPLTALRACNVDSDCTTFIPNFECSATHTHIGACPMSIASASLDAGLAYVSSLEAELCPQLPGCSSADKCAARHVACLQGQCWTLVGDGGIVP